MSFFNFRWWVILLAILTTVGFTNGSNPKAETILINGKFYTVDENKKWAEAIAIKDGVIIYVGSAKGVNTYKNDTTKIIDLEGRFTLPAFIDSHLHPLSNSYAALFQVALFELDSSKKYLEAIKEFANNIPENLWVIGAGFDAFAFDQLGPRKEVLDRILLNRPIAIVDRDIHSMLVNSKALELIGITKNTPDPNGGSIKRDKNGEATGLLIDDSAMNLARGFFPTPTKEQYKKSLLWMQDWLNREGITTAHDAWVETDPNYYEAFDELAKEGKLTVRYRGSWYINPITTEEEGTYLEAIEYTIGLAERFNHPHFQVKSFKFLTDNVLEQDSALLLDGSGGVTGVRNWQQSDMQRAYIKVDKAGYQIHVHTVGDGGVRVTLDAFDKVESENGGRDSRHSLAHVEVAAPVDIKRVGNLGLTAHLTTVNLETEPDYFKNTASKFHCNYCQ
jgi:predicted amidohydrolase YtcJ